MPCVLERGVVFVSLPVTCLTSGNSHTRQAEVLGLIALGPVNTMP